MHAHNDVLCSAREVEKKTLFHFLWTCYAIVITQYHIMGRTLYSLQTYVRYNHQAYSGLQ